MKKKEKHSIPLINGYFLCRQLTGIERYAYEITTRLDKLCEHGKITMIIPKDTVNVPEYRNINIIRRGKTIQHVLWQMFTVQFFLIFHKQYLIIDFGNTCLPFAPGIVFLHDIYCELFPEDFTSKRDKFARSYNRWQYRLIAKKAKHIVTVSHYSKNQIVKTYSIDPDRVSVIYSSWNHYKNIIADHYYISNSFPELQEPFYFSLGSLSKRKNIKWIVEYAKKNPKALFAISGVSLPTAKADELKFQTPKNIILLGYLDDAKVKSLMEKCKAFILPSYYEGFGLTPLEALSCGAEIIISNAASLPEIYGETAHYIDPYNTDVNLEKILRQPVVEPEDLLKKYSYDISAQQVFDLINAVINAEITSIERT